MLATVTIKVLLSHFVFRLPFSFVTDDVVQATCQCLLAQASNAENVSLVCCSANLRRINELHLHFNKCAHRRIICKVKLYLGSVQLACHSRGEKKKNTLQFAPFQTFICSSSFVCHQLHHNFQ